MNALGNFWDWAFPYFPAHLKNLFTGQAWASINLGQPLGYASNFFQLWLMRLVGFTKLPPGLFELAILLLILGLSCYFLIKILPKGKYRIFLAVAWIFSSPLFYKLLSGQLSYLFAIPVFVALIYFVLCKLDKNIVSYIILGLLLAFVGIQIQFFAFAAIFILIYFLFNRDQFSWKYCWLLIVVPFLINLPWLSNFLVGANGVSATSQGATVMQFAGTEFASLQRIFFMIFSPATDIQYAYDRWMLIYFGIFTALVYGSILYYYSVKKKNVECGTRNRMVDVIVANLIVFTLLGTGYFQKIPIPFIKVLYPMFRESGHFAPIIILFEILTFAFILPIIIDSIKNYQIKSGRKFLLTTYSLLLTAYLVGFISINAYTFYKYLPRVNFADARKQFQSFEDFGMTDNSTYRVLTYPFWNQYGSNDVANVVKNGKLLNNSGWDSFIEFSGKDHISNYQAGGQSINDTLQYRLLTTDDITELEQKNVKYIYDLQNIYTSNWNLYTSPDTYDNNLALIKNDPNFIAKLMVANPGKITKVSDNIYELNDSLPRIYLPTSQPLAVNGQPSLSFQKINPTKYKITIKNLKNTADLNFLESYHPDWKIYLGNYNLLSKPLFDSAHKEIFGYANGWIVDKTDIVNQNSKNYFINPDGSIDVNLTLYFWPQTPFIWSVILSLITIVSTLAVLFFQKLAYTNVSEKIK